MSNRVERGTSSPPGAVSELVLEMAGVRKVFGEHVVLHDVDLSVARGQCVVLIGASGSGKSTLLRCANLLETVDDGVITFEGEDVTDPRVDADAVRARMGLVFQAYNLFPHLTVLGNVTLALRKVHGVPEEEASARGLAMLDRVGLASKARARPDDLSGGQQQRVAIARALVANPRLMLLDEVTSALDPELVGEVLDLLTDLKAEGVTMVLNTHEMGFARDVADTVCFLHDGVIHESGSPEQVIGDPEQGAHPGVPVTAAARLGPEVGAAEPGDPVQGAGEVDTAGLVAAVEEEHQLPGQAVHGHRLVPPAQGGGLAGVGALEPDRHLRGGDQGATHQPQRGPQRVVVVPRELARLPPGLGTPQVLVVDEELDGVDQVVDRLEGHRGEAGVAEAVHEAVEVRGRRTPHRALGEPGEGRNDDPGRPQRAVLAHQEVGHQVACGPVATQGRGVGSDGQGGVGQRVPLGSGEAHAATLGAGG